MYGLKWGLSKAYIFRFSIDTKWNDDYIIARILNKYKNIFNPGILETK